MKRTLQAEEKLNPGNKERSSCSKDKETIQCKVKDQPCFCHSGSDDKDKGVYVQFEAKISMKVEKQEPQGPNNTIYVPVPDHDI